MLIKEILYLIILYNLLITHYLQIILLIITKIIHYLMLITNHSSQAYLHFKMPLKDRDKLTNYLISPINNKINWDKHKLE